MFSFSERRSSFSLKIRAIGPLDFDGARRENVLRGAGYAWTPDLWSFLKLQEVGFLPIWVLFLLLSVLRMFRLFEAVRGRLIGPKTWDRIDKIFGRKNGATVAAPRLIWCEKNGYCGVDHVLVWKKAGNGRVMRVHQVNRCFVILRE